MSLFKKKKVECSFKALYNWSLQTEAQDELNKDFSAKKKKSVIKIKALKQVIIFSVNKIFNTINTGAGLSLATSFTTAKELHLFRSRISIRTHQTGDLSDAHSNFTSAPTSAETVQETKSFSRTSVNCTQMRCWQAICQYKPILVRSIIKSIS